MSGVLTICDLASNVDTAAPYDSAYAGHSLNQIFLNEAEFEAFLVHQPHKEPPAQLTGVYLSPYLKVMIHVIQKFNLSYENQETHDALKTAMREAWTGPGTLSNNLAEAMATLVRDPSAQLGKNKPKPMGSTRQVLEK